MTEYLPAIEILPDRADIDRARANMPDGMAGGVATETARYEAPIRQAGAIHVQALGIGTNGHAR